MGAAGAAVVAVALGGCAGRPAPQAGPVHHPDVWESVFLPAETEAAVGGGGAGELAGFDRNDYRLSVVEAQPLTASGDWPEQERASLDNTRYVCIPRQANTMLFFLPDRAPRRAAPWYGW